MTLNACLTPPNDVSKAIIQLASSLAHDDLLFAVDGSQRHPHLTVLMQRTKRKYLGDYVSHFRNASLTGPLRCTAYGLTQSSNGYVEIGFNRSDALEKLQQSSYQVVADLWRDDRELTDRNLSLEERANDRRYGYKLFDGQYRPHITLGAYNENRASIALPQLADFHQFDFTASDLTIGVSDHYGALVRIIERIRL